MHPPLQTAPYRRFGHWPTLHLAISTSSSGWAGGFRNWTYDEKGGTGHCLRVLMDERG